MKMAIVLRKNYSVSNYERVVQIMIFLTIAVFILKYKIL